MCLVIIQSLSMESLLVLFNRNTVFFFEYLAEPISGQIPNGCQRVMPVCKQQSTFVHKMMMNSGCPNLTFNLLTVQIVSINICVNEN